MRVEVEARLARSVAADDESVQETGAGYVAPDGIGLIVPGTVIGPYRVESLLGSGGMGRVYRAIDTRLGRQVAIKFAADKFNPRFEREARTISTLNHPHICTLFDVGRLADGSAYLVTELVEGSTLREVLKQSPSTERSLAICRQVAEALRAAHDAGIVHRDLKPENVMVRPDGYVKVLDFGLAKRLSPSRSTPGPFSAEVSVPGQIMGTPSYMSPEQAMGHDTDARSDLFSLGIVFYEMLEGRRPWTHQAPLDVMHAIVHDQAAPMSATSEPAAYLHSVVERLLRKAPADRFQSAQALLHALARPEPAVDRSALVPPRGVTRLIVLPFRILRHDDASDFLAISLPDAITSSLAAIDSIVVRSTAAAARYPADAGQDIQTIAEHAQVDAVLTGTILSHGEQLRVNAQLVDAPGGALLWSDTSTVSLHDIFRLQDDLVDRIVESLHVPLTTRERRALKHDVPASALGYELYLRGNQLVAAGLTPQNMLLARDLYQASIEADSRYAPAWACLGRALRFLGKYAVEDPVISLGRAEEAFRKSFNLNPDLALAHHFYSALQTDMGRSVDAMGRLLTRAHTYRNDVNLLAALVQTCRYGGLLDASVAAHNQAKALDPQARTSVAYTYLRLGDYAKALEHAGPTDAYVKVPSLMALGRGDEVLEWVEKAQWRDAGMQAIGILLRAIVEGDHQKGREALDQVLKLTVFHTSDPEARFCVAAMMAKVGDVDRSLSFLSLALDEGYASPYALLHDPWLDPLRSSATFASLVSRAAEMSGEAMKMFQDSGGNTVLALAARLTSKVGVLPTN